MERNGDYKINHYRVYDPITQIETFSDSDGNVIRTRISSLNEIALMLQNADFEIAERYGDVDRRHLTSKALGSGQPVFVAKIP